jgi:hypothetical protein
MKRLLLFHRINVHTNALNNKLHVNCLSYISSAFIAMPLVKMSTRNIYGGKGGRCVRLTNPPPSCAECHEI